MRWARPLIAGGMVGFLSGWLVPSPWCFLVSVVGGAWVGVWINREPHQHSWEQIEAWDNTYVRRCRNCDRTEVKV